LPSEGRRPHARFLFGAQFRHDLALGFPAVTTKQLYFHNVVKEVLWFLRGETSVRTLGSKIWDSWSDSQTGQVAAAYGSTWRHWPYPVGDAGVPLWWSSDQPGPEGLVEARGWDQIEHVVADLKAVAANPGDRARRRIFLTGWCPPLVPLSGLPPCHTVSQWLPANGKLHVSGFFRSIDLFTGFPFNVAQYSLLCHLFCAVTGLVPGTLLITITDAHIYDNQVESVREQLTRTPREPHPVLETDPIVRELAPGLTLEQCGRLRPEMFLLRGYGYDARPLRAEVAV
jgi:thymidylate synthase